MVQRMQLRATALLLMASLYGGFATERAVYAQRLFQRFLPVAKVATSTQQDYSLTKEHGPWLITAATFSGDGAAEQARQLVLELRRRFNLPAYHYQMTFELGDDLPGRGIDKYGAPVRRRYQSGNEKREWAVLIGDFPTVDDSEGQQLLNRVKSLTPEALQPDDSDPASQGWADIRRFRQTVLASFGKKRDQGPMSKAFMAPNPLLPTEYFVPKGVDRFVEQMNKGVRHSLLDCRGKYTVKIATFRGTSVLQTSGQTDPSGGVFGRSKDDSDSGLVEAAENAHLLTNQLRQHDWEAFEFHDRDESIVTIGSFDRAKQLADGRFAPSTSQAQLIIETFGAAYNTPGDPLLGDDLVNRRKREHAIQQFNSTFASQTGPVAAGLNPKHVKILKGRKLVRTIPMDIYPLVIEAPKKSISSAYMRSWR